jgi:hypothetical protein
VDARLLIDRVLDDEGLTAGLDEAEASALVQALTERVTRIANTAKDETTAERRTNEVCQRGRKIAKVVCAFRDDGAEASRKLAHSYAFTWPAGTLTVSDLTRHLIGELDCPAD